MSERFVLGKLNRSYKNDDSYFSLSFTPPGTHARCAMKEEGSVRTTFGLIRENLQLLAVHGVIDLAVIVVFEGGLPPGGSRGNGDIAGIIQFVQTGSGESRWKRMRAFR